MWKYDEDKCVSWLESKVLSVSKVLKEQLIDLSGGAAALSYKQESSAAPKLGKLFFENYNRYFLLKKLFFHNLILIVV